MNKDNHEYLTNQDFTRLYILLSFLQFYLHQNQQTIPNFQGQLLFSQVFLMKEKVKKTLDLRIAIVNIQKVTKRNKRKLIRRRTITILTTVAGFYFLPASLNPLIQVVNATDIMPVLFEKTKKGIDWLVWKKDEDGNYRLNTRNIFLLTSGAALGGAIIFFLNSEENMLSRVLFRPKLEEIIAPLSPVALTLLEREKVNEILTGAAKDVKSRQLLLDNIKITSIYKQFIEGKHTVNEKNAKRFMKTLTRTVFHGIDIAQTLVKYKDVMNQDDPFSSYLKTILELELTPKLNIYKRSFYETFKQFLGKADPKLGSSIQEYFKNNIDALFEIENLNANEVIFNKTVEDLLNVFSQQDKK
jgi:hypothetical protein